MTNTSRTRKSGQKPGRKTPPADPQAAKPEVTRPRATKLDRLAALLAQHHGASIAEMTAATGCQPHSVRGALAGSLKRRGLTITSKKVEGVRRYWSKASQ